MAGNVALPERESHTHGLNGEKAARKGAVEFSTRGSVRKKSITGFLRGRSVSLSFFLATYMMVFIELDIYCTLLLFLPLEKYLCIKSWIIAHL